MGKSVKLKKIFGKNVKKIRELRGYSQEKLAEIIGIGVPALSNIECGKSYPSEVTVEKIIEIFEIEPYLLYINEEDYNLEEAYLEVLEKIEILKTNKDLFKRAYDFITQLTQNL